MACEDGMSAAAECVIMCRERPLQNTGRTEDGFVVRKLWHPTDDRPIERTTDRLVKRAGRQSHSHRIGADKK